MRTSTKGFNLVEILITLSIVALLTTMVVNAVTDYKDRVRMVRVKSDLMTIAAACKYVEATERTLIVTLSETGTEVASDIANYIIKLPSEDPWGRRFHISANGTVIETGGLGPAYVIDRGMGRIISPGPDGICDTKLGFGPSDRDRDIVVEFRQVPWIVYNIFTASHPAGAIFMARGDGSLLPELIVNGAQNMQVSADRRLMCFMSSPGNVLQWGLVDRTPTLRTVASGPPVIGANLYPFWAPDNVHIVVINNKNLFSVNSDSGKCRQLTFDSPIQDNVLGPIKLTASDGYRTFFNDGQVSYLQHPAGNTGTVADIFVTVSLDGKVAYLNQNHQGIDMVLLDGTGHRTIKPGVLLPAPGLWYRPLFWMSSEVLVYLKPLHKYVARIKQDGSYDMDLWGPTQVVNAVSYPATLDAPLVGVSPSPDRSMVLLYSLVAHPAGGYRVVKTDGSGCVPNTTLNMINANNGGGPITWAVPLWKRNQQGVFVPGADPANVRSLNFTSASGVPLWESGVGAIATNDLTGYAPWAWDLDRNNTLIAMISAKVGASLPTGTPGVFVYPVNGPDDAITKLGGEVPNPLGGTTFSIFWLK